VRGLGDELRTIRKGNLRDRFRAFKRSRLSLTEFGKAVVAHKEDFSRHNRPLVGRLAPDQRQPLALESGAGEAVKLQAVGQAT
jgi:hypothetical protein